MNQNKDQCPASRREQEHIEPLATLKLHPIPPLNMRRHMIINGCWRAGGSSSDEGLPLDIFEYLPRSSREDCAMVGQLVQYFLHGRQSVQELADHDLRRGRSAILNVPRPLGQQDVLDDRDTVRATAGSRSLPRRCVKLCRVDDRAIVIVRIANLVDEHGVVREFVYQ